VAANNYEMSAQESAGFEQADDVRRDSGNTVDARGNAEPGLPAQFLLMRPEPFVQIAFALRERAAGLFGFGGARSKRPLMPCPIESFDQVFPGPDFLPVKTAAIGFTLFTEFQETLVELDGIDGNPALFGGKLFRSQSLFPLILY
jgi:hypothetical protein